MGRHVLHGLLDGAQHPLVDTERAPHRAVRHGHGPAAGDGRQREVFAVGADGRGRYRGRRGRGRRGRGRDEPRRDRARSGHGPDARARRRRHGADGGGVLGVGLAGDGAQRGQPLLGAVTLLPDGGCLCFRVGLLLLQGPQRVLEHDFGVLLGAVHGHVPVGGGGRAPVEVGGELRVGLGGVRGVGRVWLRQGLLGLGLGVLEAADDLVAHAGAGGQAGLDADDTLDGVADLGRGGVGDDAHEAGHGVDEVGDVVGGVNGGAVAALAADEQAVALLEAVDPAGGELGGLLVLVARQGREDGLGLVGELLVGGVAAAVLRLLVPEQHELLDVGPVAEAQTRARQLRVTIEAGVLGRQRVRDGRLRDGLAVLALEPVDARLVRRPHRLRIGPATQRAPLVERERVPLLGRRRRGLGRDVAHRPLSNPR
ncbi:hypothetical protein B0H67DRAFT_242241 [Lasiosphaeris hirsuta]|uniref:Uncharacterized protein n=1 Tax=Lasiosphaeris hirsuta TaxID=260670 RepID=A0AA40DWD5_9PEZI|nr:hypothetical protein B0H67DRAFT_242241 [Lasiosphaeris hirsuta]